LRLKVGELAAKAVLYNMIGHKALDIVDADRVVQLTAVAFLLAGVRAYAPRTPGRGILLEITVRFFS